MEEMFLMKPKIDYAFKEIMMDERARTGFLAAVLKLDPSEIKETVILNTNLRKTHGDEKQGILDVRILMDDAAEIDIEIQLSVMAAWADRSLFYLSKMYTEQIRPGQNYTVFKKCVGISILDFDLLKGRKEFYSCFHISEDTSRILYTDKMEFQHMELPKLPEELKEDSGDLLLWAKFINAEKKEEFDMLAQKNPYISSAYQQLQAVSRDREKRLEYEAREKAVLDYNQMMFESEQKGLEQGLEQGLERGLRQGETYQLIRMVKRKMEKGKTAVQIASELDEELALVEKIHNAINAGHPDDSCEKIFDILCGQDVGDSANGKE